jgi:hypothetical protein
MKKLLLINALKRVIVRLCEPASSKRDSMTASGRLQKFARQENEGLLYLA